MWVALMPTLCRPEGGSQPQGERPHHQAARGERQGGQAVAVVGRHQEVGGEAYGGQQRPQHPADVDLGGAEHVEHEHQPQHGQHRAGDREGPRPLPATQPEPHHHHHDAEVLEEQPDRDRQRLDGEEVGQLAQGHGDEAEQQHAAPTPTQRVPTAAQGVEAERQQRHGPHRHAPDHGARGRPAGGEQALGQRPGGAERGGGDEAEEEAEQEGAVQGEGPLPKRRPGGRQRPAYRFGGARDGQGALSVGAGSRASASGRRPGAWRA